MDNKKEFAKGGDIIPDEKKYELNKGESVIPTRQEILYFNIKIALKVFRPVKIRSKFLIVLDEISKKLPIKEN